MHAPTTDEIVTAALHELLAQLVRSGLPPSLRASNTTGGGWAVAITVQPSEAASTLRVALSDTERDIVSVLAEAPCRLATKAILEALDRRGAIHGEATVKRALASLVRRRAITSSRVAPRGYALHILSDCA